MSHRTVAKSNLLASFYALANFLLLNFALSRANDDDFVFHDGRVSRAPIVWVSLEAKSIDFSTKDVAIPNFLYLPPRRHSNATLFCNIFHNHTGLPPLTVTSLTWTKNGQQIDTAKLDSLFTIDGNKLHFGQFHEAKLFHGEYACNVSFSHFGALSSPPCYARFAGFKQTKKEKIRNVTAYPNSTAVIPCYSRQPEPLHSAKRFYLKDNKTKITRNIPDKYFFTPSGLQIKLGSGNSTASDSGFYQCVSENTITGRKDVGRPVKLTVKLETEESMAIKAVVPVQSRNELHVNSGDNATLECIMRGRPRPSISWERYGGSLPANRHAFYFDNLLIYNASTEDEGSYLCKSEAAPDTDLNKYRALPFAVYSLVVNEPVKARMRLSRETNSCRLVCDSVGGRATDALVFYNGRSLLDGRLAKLISVDVEGDDGKPTWTASFEGDSAPPGFYQCLLSNKYSRMASVDNILVRAGDSPTKIAAESSTTSRAFAREEFDDEDDNENDDDDDDDEDIDRMGDTPVLADFEPVDAPLSPQIALRPENISVYEGSPVTLLCQVSNADAVFWTKDGRPVELGDRLDILGSGTLEIRAVAADDRGFYSCSATNIFGNASAGAFLTVDSPSPPLDDAIQTPDEVGHQSPFDSDPRQEQQEEEDEEEMDSPRISTSPAPAPDINSNSRRLRFEFDSPNVYRFSEASVLLTWNISAKWPSDDSPESYRVQFKRFGEPDAKWQTKEEQLPDAARSALLEGLSPGNKYKFRIGAVFRDGKVATSRATKKFHLAARTTDFAAPSAAPKFVSLAADSPSSLRLVWDYSRDASPVQGYLIAYKRAYSTGPNSATTNNETVIGGLKSEYVIRNLLPATPYEIKICAFNEGGRGPFSNTILQSTLTSDWSPSPLSFLPVADNPERTVVEKPEIVQATEGSTVGKQAINDDSASFNIFGLSRGTFLILALAVTALILSLTVISSIAWSVTARHQRRNVSKNVEGKFRDTSRSIHYEQSLKRPKPPSDDATNRSDFYSMPFPDYDSSCALRLSPLEPGSPTGVADLNFPERRNLKPKSPTMIRLYGNPLETETLLHEQKPEMHYIVAPPTMRQLRDHLLSLGVENRAPSVISFRSDRQADPDYGGVIPRCSTLTYGASLADRGRRCRYGNRLDRVVTRPASSRNRFRPGRPFAPFDDADRSARSAALDSTNDYRSEGENTNYRSTPSPRPLFLPNKASSASSAYSSPRYSNGDARLPPAAPLKPPRPVDESSSLTSFTGRPRRVDNYDGSPASSSNRELGAARCASPASSGDVNGDGSTFSSPASGEARRVATLQTFKPESRSDNDCGPGDDSTR